MAPPKYHIFVCANQRPPGHPKGCCSDRGGMSVLQKFSEVLNLKMAYDRMMISSTKSCLVPCQYGPVAVVYPDGVWYCNIQPEDVEEIYQSHIVEGKPVERLLLPKEVFG
ncbi:MAG: (2Fe-2S) ferredoxin domain-containing protein [Nitrospinota bacterium]|nr:(2Fe-2S) ferredoxin domain-containing protein [Nitrospinota bacterium]